jgi:membrane-bound lytic murein transglycosylase F
MPGTAKELGIEDPLDAEQSIRGGLRYMDQLRKRYKDVADPIERHRFALAAYNTGFGHVDDARRLAQRDGKSTVVWREVAPYLLKLSDPRVARKTRFGHCRGTEPVDYVQDIDERYTAYVQLLPASKPAEIQSD